jgi:hypothetical protein
MMHRHLTPASRWLLRALVLVLVFESAGCAWFRHRREGRNADAEIAAVSAQEAERRAARATVATQAPAEPVVSTAAGPAAVLSDADATAARKLAGDFYEMHARFAGRGLPDPGAMNAYDAFLCPSLSAALGDARARQAAFIAAHPGDKPPLIEGDLFTSLFEGADSARALDAVADGDGARVDVALARGVGTGATRWHDALVLGRDGDIWCVADVAYGGTWPIANKGRLSDLLKSSF